MKHVSRTLAENTLEQSEMTERRSQGLKHERQGRVKHGSFGRADKSMVGSAGQGKAWWVRQGRGKHGGFGRADKSMVGSAGQKKAWWARQGRLKHGG